MNHTRHYPLVNVLTLALNALGLLLGLLLGLELLLWGVAEGQEKSVRPGINDSFKDPDLKKYQGIFEGESREIYTHRLEIVRKVGLKPGMTVADIGAGTGLFTRLFAQEVGPKGKVYAVDIAPKFLEHIRKTAKESGISNITTVQCSIDSTDLPPQSVDRVFICDTYHHFEYPHKTMASVHRALRPGGQVILIDFHRIPGKSRPWILEHVRAGQEVFVREILQSGFRQIQGNEADQLLMENYLLRFEKSSTPAPK